MLDSLRKLFGISKNFVNPLDPVYKHPTLREIKKLKRLSAEEKIAFALRERARESDILKLINMMTFYPNYVDPKTHKSLLEYSYDYMTWMSIKGQTPSFKIQDALLDKGADPFRKDENNHSFFDMVVSSSSFFNPKMFKPHDFTNFKIISHYPEYAAQTPLTAALSEPVIYSEITLKIVNALIEMDPELLHTPNSKGLYPIDIVLNKSETSFFTGYVLKVFESLVKKGLITKERASDYIVNLFKDEEGQYDKALVMLEHIEDIDLSYKDEEGNTLAHLWAKSFARNYRSQLNAITYKIAEKVYPTFDINAQNKLGQTPMMLAIQEGSWEETVDYIGHVDTYKMSRDIQIKKILADPHFDPLVKDNQGLTAYDYAQKYPLKSEELLLQLSVKTNEALEQQGVAEQRKQLSSSFVARRVAHKNLPQDVIEEQNEVQRNS